MLMAMPEVGHVSQREAGQQSFGRNFPTILSVAEQIFPDLVAHCLRGATVICNDYCSFFGHKALPCTQRQISYVTKASRNVRELDEFQGGHVGSAQTKYVRDNRLRVLNNSAL